jgi:hypothetical protein
VKNPILHLARACLCLTMGLPSSASPPQIQSPNNRGVPKAGETRTLRPSAFPELPETIQKRLETLGCAVPQVPGEAKPQNVVQGSFARPAQTDWAVLCSRAGKSSILIFWGKPTTCSSELAIRDDSNYLQGDAEGHLVYSRQISISNTKKILQYAQAFNQDGNGKAPDYPRLDHAGIEDIFVGKGSAIYYCSQGKWQTLQGAD